jgi:hypothetical protein
MLVVDLDGSLWATCTGGLLSTAPGSTIEPSAWESAWPNERGKGYGTRRNTCWPTNLKPVATPRCLRPLGLGRSEGATARKVSAMKSQAHQRPQRCDDRAR